MSGYRMVAYGCGLALLLLVAGAVWVRYYLLPRLIESRNRSAQEKLIFEDPVLPIPVLPIPPLAESLAKIERWMADNHVPNATALRPGLAADEIDRQLAEAGLSSSAELRTLYGWHDGQEDVGELIPGYRFLPLAEAVAECRRWSGTVPEWLPILWLDDTDAYVVPTYRNEAETSPLYDFFLEEPDIGISYPSLAAFFAEEKARFAAGAYKIDDEAHFDLDPYQEWQVHQTYYPGAGALHHVMILEDTRLPDGSLKRVSDDGSGSRLEFLISPRGHLLHEIAYHGIVREVRAETVKLDAAGRPLVRRYSRHYRSEITWEWKEGGEVTIRVWIDGKLSSTTEARTKNDGRLQVLTAPL